MTSTISYSQKFPTITKGTCIICIGRNDTVWIGADSKTVDERGLPGVPKCKIIITKDFVFAHAGITTANFVPVAGLSGKFNIDSLFYYCLGKGHTMRGTIDAFKKDGFHKFIEVGASWSQSKKFFIGEIDSIRAECFFAQYKNGKTQIIGLYFLTSVGNRKGSKYIFINTQFDSTTFVSRPNIIGARFGGIYDKIRGITLSEVAKNSNVALTIKKLINIEIETYPEYIGKPINIVRIDKGGIQWVEKKEPCK